MEWIECWKCEWEGETDELTEDGECPKCYAELLPEPPTDTEGDTE